MNNERITLPDSDDSASIETVTGWVDREGRFWGNDERMARWSGATHVPCAGCGKPIEKRGYSKCGKCRFLQRLGEFESFEKKPWDGTTPICIHDGDEYFFDKQDLIDWCEQNETHPTHIELVHCEPRYASQIDTDHWCDDLPEDGELPAEIEEALAEFNQKIAACTTPLSWWPTKIAVDYASLDWFDGEQK